MPDSPKLWLVSMRVCRRPQRHPSGSLPMRSDASLHASSSACGDHGVASGDPLVLVRPPAGVGLVEERGDDAEPPVAAHGTGLVGERRRTCRRAGCARTRRSTRPRRCRRRRVRPSRRAGRPRGRRRRRGRVPRSRAAGLLALASAVSSWISVRSSAVSFSPEAMRSSRSCSMRARAIAEIPVLGQHRAAAAHGVVGRDDVPALGVEHRRELVERHRAAPAVLAGPAGERNGAVAGGAHGDGARAPGSRCCRRRRRR